MLLALLVSAQTGFNIGYKHLISKLFILGAISRKKKKLPCDKSFENALDKLPIEAVTSLISKSHDLEFSAGGNTFHGLKVIIADGTKIAHSRSKSVIKKFGLACGHYPQALAVGFFELSTATFEDFKIALSNTSERALAYLHMQERVDKGLYLLDAGYNGMAFIAMTQNLGQEILMPLKLNALATKMKASKERSCIHEIKINKQHLRNYPDQQHLTGQVIKVRLIRALGTSKLESQILITTMLDEKLYPWKELAKLYRQRYIIEVAFRHLKVNLNLESIKTRKLSRIEKFLFAAVALYNLASILRNRIKMPQLLPEKKGIKMYCLSFCLDQICLFCIAVIKPRRGDKTAMSNCLKAIKNCWFIYKPWRASARVCYTPSSKFAMQKGKKASSEKEKIDFLMREYKILGVQYGQIPA